MEIQVDYTIERVDTLDRDLKIFLLKEIPALSKKYGSIFDLKGAALEHMIQRAYFLVCRRDGKVTGIHISWLFTSPLDLNVKILQQQLFFVKEGSGRSAYHLFKKFIDIGKSEAHHIITMISEHTNIKQSTLKSWGFSELETLYRLKV